MVKMVNFMLLVFDHNWKKELNKKKEMTVKAVTSERLLLPVQQYKAIAGTSGAWLWGKVGLVWEALQRSPWTVSGPISCDSWTGQRSRAEATLMAYMSPVTSALPVSFQELEDCKWEALTAGLGGWPEGEDVLHMALNQQPMASDLMHAFVASLWNAFKKRGPSVAK